MNLQRVPYGSGYRDPLYMYTTEGVVLKKLDVGEADVLYAIYTRDYGKIRALAQGIRKGEAKLRGHLEPYSLSAIRFVIGRGGERLIAASLVSYRDNLRSRESTLRLAAAVAAAFDEHCFAGERDDNLWKLLHDSLVELDREIFFEEAEAPFLKEFQARLQAGLGYGEGRFGTSEMFMAKPAPSMECRLCLGIWPCRVSPSSLSPS